MIEKGDKSGELQTKAYICEGNSHTDVTVPTQSRLGLDLISSSLR